MNANRRAMLLMIGFVSSWAAVEVIAAHLLRHYSPYQVVWTRYAVHLMLMLLVWGWRKPQVLWRTRRPAYQLARSLLMLGMPASWIAGMHTGMAADTLMAIFWLSPLLILALAWLVLGDRVVTPVWTVTALGCVGALVLHTPRSLGPLQQLVFPFGMALCFSLYVVMTRSLRTEDVRANLFYTALGVLVALTPFMPALWITPQAGDLLSMVAVGVLGFVGLFLLDRMAAAAPVSISAPFAYLQLVAMIVLALAVGASTEVSMRRMAAGLLLIGGAALYVWVSEPRWRIRDALVAPPAS